jgi:LacI family transcriptional regulator
LAERATIRDVAELAGVSVGSISNYLTSKKAISDRARARIESAIDELGFIPNSAVRVMRGQRNNAIGFMIPDSSNPFFSEVARGVEDVAIAAGYVVVICNTNGDDSRENHYARALSEMRVVGAIATPLSASEKNLKQLANSGASIVLLGSGEQPLAFSSVDVDDVEGGYLAATHLIERGHTDIVFYGGPGAGPQIHARFEGLKRAYRAASLDPELMRRVDADGNSTAARLEGARRVIEMTPRPTAAFCANDLLAIALEAEVLRSGIRVPEDFEIVGYDDIDGAQMAPVPLTTIRQPQFEIGKAAATLLLEHAKEEVAHQHISFSPRLIERASTNRLAL